MAVQLRRKLPASSQMYIFDIEETVLHRFVREMGLEGHVVNVMRDAKEVAENSEFIITIVPEVGAAVSSSAPLKTTPPKFYDAPVSGGTPGASKATLTFMVGASPTDPHLPLLNSIFSFMGTSIHAMGGPSLGLAAKLSNNYLSGAIALATAEAMNLGMRLGLDPKVLSDCIATSSGASWVNSTVNPVPGVCPDAVTSKGYEGGFKVCLSFSWIVGLFDDLWKVQLMKKDITLAMEAAKQVDAKLVVGDAVLSAYTAAADDPRCRDRDSRVVYRWYVRPHNHITDAKSDKIHARLGGVEPLVEH
ncbi:hypothetical protein H0H92_007053 [Tricholoma furcatifolium]|nr:hypothetical protein H0H92_007053 [Tricholoma furcatifolium]